MTTMFKQPRSKLRGVRRVLSERSRSERGASMVEYVLLLGLISLVAFFAVGTLGGSISNLFSHEAGCISSQSTIDNRSSVGQLSTANSLSTGNSLSSGLRISTGAPASGGTSCGTSTNSGNQQSVLQLLR